MLLQAKCCSIYIQNDFNLNVTSAIWTKDGKRVYLQSVDGVTVFDSTDGRAAAAVPDRQFRILYFFITY